MISFDHNGTTIWSPFLSECGRFAASPRHYGFILKETTEGTAWVRELEGGITLEITDQSGAHAPESNDDALIAAYDDHQRLIIKASIPSEDEIEAIQNTRFIAVWGDNFHNNGLHQTVDMSFFSTDNGYDLADAHAISSLVVGQAWGSRHYRDHSVVRIQ